MGSIVRDELKLRKVMDEFYNQDVKIPSLRFEGKGVEEIGIIDNINLEKYQTLVIDAEGSEKLILDGAKELLPYLKNIKLENGNVNFFNEKNYNQEIDVYLKKFNFIEKKRTEIYKNSQGKLYDILYSKV